MASLSSSISTRRVSHKGQARRIIGKIIIYIVLTVGALVAIFPFFWMISTSFMTLGETINRQLLPKTPQFVNYVDAWSTAKFGKYFFNSVMITAGSLSGLLITSIMAGYAFARIDFKGTGPHFCIIPGNDDDARIGHLDPELPDDPRCNHSFTGWLLAQYLLGPDGTLHRERV